ncbi:sigma-54-dependent transcriptional regulator, partial [Pseudomonadota bacterium]
CNFFVKPLQFERLSGAVNECLKRQRRETPRSKIVTSAARLEVESSIVGQSTAIQQTRQLIERIAPKSTTVLIEGETGTGKELVAREIHKLSGRSGKFVPLNCGSVPMELLESEMYGHTRGAYTGAHEAREGLFVHANGGSLFLDEIDEMLMPIQTRLLRVIEDRVVRPVGSDREILVDTRLIAATNRQLSEQVVQGRFRDDLYYRLNVVLIQVPPLRERLDDVPILATNFAEKFASEHDIGQLPFTYNDLEMLKEYSWPGNVRELKNVIERSLLLDMSPSECVATKTENSKASSNTRSVNALPLDWSLAEVEKFHLLNVLDSVSGNKSEAARKLGVSRKTMERKLKSWNCF